MEGYEEEGKGVRGVLEREEGDRNGRVWGRGRGGWRGMGKREMKEYEEEGEGLGRKEERVECKDRRTGRQEATEMNKGRSVRVGLRGRRGSEGEGGRLGEREEQKGWRKEGKGKVDE